MHDCEQHKHRNHARQNRRGFASITSITSINTATAALQASQAFHRKHHTHCKQRAPQHHKHHAHTASIATLQVSRAPQACAASTATQQQQLQEAAHNMTLRYCNIYISLPLLPPPSHNSWLPQSVLLLRNSPVAPSSIKVLSFARSRPPSVFCSLRINQHVSASKRNSEGMKRGSNQQLYTP